MGDEKPELRKENGSTTIDAVVTLSVAGLMRKATEFSNESTRFLDEAKFSDGRKRKAYLINTKADECWDCASCLQMMSILASQLPVLRVKVDGEDAAAEQIALRLYSALTYKKPDSDQEESLKLDFYRFEK